VLTQTVGLIDAHFDTVNLEFFCQISKFDEAERALGCPMAVPRDDRCSFLMELELHEPRTISLTHAAGLCVAPGYSSPELSLILSRVLLRFQLSLRKAPLQLSLRGERVARFNFSPARVAKLNRLFFVVFKLRSGLRTGN
jgi:hypothetical protein